MAPDSSPDVSLYLGVATAIATSLGASVSLGLLKPADRDISRIWSAAVLSMAVLGIGAALIAVGKGHSTTLLTRVMFVGLLLPALYALHGALDRMFLRRRSVNATFAALAIAVCGLLLWASPSFVEKLFNPHDLEAERRDAFRIASTVSKRRTFVCVDEGQNCLGPPYVSFNAYRNNPKAGDERYFVAARHIIDEPSLPKRTEFVSNTLLVHPGDEVMVRVFFNNAADFVYRLDGTPDRRSFARNARLALATPSESSAGIVITGSLYADNAKPSVVTDSVALISTEAIHVEYIPGSASLRNNFFRHGVRMSDFIDERPSPQPDYAQYGAQIGYSLFDGRVGGTFNESGWVTARYRIY